jgi:choline dehydrogenase-like flavoprotein
VLTDARGLEANATLSADLCIVGAGAAGITIAHELLGSGLDVVLVEGGGLQPTERSQRLYEAEMLTVYRSREKDGDYPLSSRLRYFGGTTNHWKGWCRPLEAIDFEARDWIPGSGWPIELAELRPWYDRAAELVEIPPYEAEHGAGRTEGLRRTLLDGNQRLLTRVFHFSPPTRFGQVYRQALAESPEVRVLLESNALRLRAAADGSRVRRLEVRAEDGPDFNIEAGAFVLAAGGIENPRLLLVSDAEQPGGLGNGHDQVGRYLMDHPHLGRFGQAVLRGPERDKHFARFYGKREFDAAVGCRSLAVLCLAAEVQRAERLMNCFVSLPRLKREERDEFGRAISDTCAAIDGWAVEPTSLARRHTSRISIRAEQGPNPESRVRLVDERDRLGQRKVSVNWALTAADAASIRRTVEVLCAEVSATTLGRGRIDVAGERPWERVKPGDHHVGTTRMGADPATSVVDRDCKLHGVDNLWVAGSSVFTTSGASNPTLTIVALAARLADHLRGVLAR